MSAFTSILKRKLPLYLLIIFVIGGLGYFLTKKYLSLEIEENINREDISREARINPYLASKMLLNQYQIETEVRYGIPQNLSNFDTIILNTGSFIQNETLVDSILNWLEQGGNLILPYQEFKSEGEVVRNEIIEELNISYGSYLVNSNLNYTLMNTRYKIQIQEFYKFTPKQKQLTNKSPKKKKSKYQKKSTHRNLRYKKGKNEPIVYLYYGKGSVFTVNNLNLFQGRNIQNADHAALFFKMIQGRGKRAIKKVGFILNNDSPNIVEVLISKYPYACLLFILSIISVIWYSVFRLGPLSYLNKGEMPGIKEHLESISHWEAKYGDLSEMYAMYLEDIFRYHLSLMHWTKIRKYLQFEEPQIENHQDKLQRRLQGITEILNQIKEPYKEFLFNFQEFIFFTPSYSEHIRFFIRQKDSELTFSLKQNQANRYDYISGIYEFKKFLHENQGTHHGRK